MSNVNLGTATYSVVVKQTGVTQFQQEQQKIVQSSYVMRRAISVATGMIVADLLRMGSSMVAEGVKMYASISQLQLAFNNLSKGATVDIDTLRTATGGLINDVNLLTQANEALARGIPLSELEEMFRIGTILGTNIGKTATEGVQLMVDGVGKMREEYLKNLGITVTTGEAYRKLAAELNVTTNELSDAQKQQAMLTEAITRGNEVISEQGINLDTANSELMRAQSNYDNLRTAIGQIIYEGLLEEIVVGFNDITESAKESTGWVLGFTAALQAATGQPIRDALRDLAKTMPSSPLDLFRISTGTGSWEQYFESLGEAASSLTAPSTGLPDFTDDATDLALGLNDIVSSYDEMLWREEALTKIGDVWAETGSLESVNDLIQEYVTHLGDAEQATKNIMGAMEDGEDRLIKNSTEITRLQSELTSITYELSKQYLNVGRAIRYASGSMSSYTEYVDTSNWTNQTAITLYEQLSNSLEPLQTRYNRLGNEINKYNNAINKNSLLMSQNRLEYMMIEDAIKDRQDAAEAQVSSLQREIDALELLGAMQGYLTFDQRRQLNVLNERKSQMEDDIDTTESEEDALRALDSEYRDLQITQAELNIEVSQLTTQYSKLGDKISDYTDKMNTLVSVMTEYMRLLNESESISEEITSNGGVPETPSTPTIDETATTGDKRREYRYVHSTDGRYATDWYSTREAALEARKTIELPANYPSSWMLQQHVVKAAGGFMGEVARPTLFLAGEAGKEHVSITPQGKGSPTSNNISINFNISGGVGDSGERRNLAKELSGVFIDELQKRGVKIY